MLRYSIEKYIVMTKLKRILEVAPEYVLLTSVLFYWISSSLSNPIAIVLLVVIVLQLIFKNKMAGFFIGMSLLMFTVYMFMALFSELNELPEFDSSATRLLVIGTLYLSVTLTASIMLIVKSLKRKE